MPKKCQSSNAFLLSLTGLAAAVVFYNFSTPRSARAAISPTLSTLHTTKTQAPDPAHPAGLPAAPHAQIVRVTD